MILETQELRVFAAIAQTGGFQKAAKQLRLTQSAVSQSLANLEHRIGEPLVVRSRPTTLTLAGVQLLGHAQAILHRQTRFFDDLVQMKQGYLQTLTIAVDHIARGCTETVQAFHRRLPGAQVNVRELPGRAVVEAVQEGEVDFGFSFFQKGMRGLKKIQLAEEASVLVVGRQVGQDRRVKRDPLGFLKQTVLLTSKVDPPHTRPSRKKIRDYFKSVWQVESIPLQREWVQRGLGAAFLPETVVERGAGLIVLDTVPFAKITKAYGVYARRDSAPTRVTQAFWESVRC